MTHSHNNSWRPRRFRAFVTNQYFANRDEYDSCGQTQPYTFDEYVRENIHALKARYRLTSRK